jgi:hypothetical protein
MPWAASGRRRADRGGQAGRHQAADGPLLDPPLLRQLELLSLDSLGSVLSPLEGEHPGAPRARLGELAGYRAYQPGDDLRLIDWNAYARLDELYVRTSAARDGMLLTLLVDCSRSMAVPGAVGAVPPLLHAKRLAAAFGAVALLHSDAPPGRRRRCPAGQPSAACSASSAGCRPATGPTCRAACAPACPPVPRAWARRCC